MRFPEGMDSSGSLITSAAPARDWGKVFFCALFAVRCASSRECARFNPFNLRIKELHCSVDIATIECGVSTAKLRNGLLCLSLIMYLALSGPDTP
jgi:hypothetical protein